MKLWCIQIPLGLTSAKCTRNMHSMHSSSSNVIHQTQHTNAHICICSSQKTWKQNHHHLRGRTCRNISMVSMFIINSYSTEKLWPKKQIGENCSKVCIVISIKNCWSLFYNEINCWSHRANQRNEIMPLRKLQVIFHMYQSMHSD